jgi:hypothetical protein
MNANTLVERIMAALPAMERAERLAFMGSHRHGQRELERLTELLAGELFIQCLMDPTLGLDQDHLVEAVGATRARIISAALWSTLCMSDAALDRFRSAYAKRYVEDVLAHLPAAAPERQAA